MATIYYTCNLLPSALVTSAGHSFRWLGNIEGASAPARRDALGVHPMTCPFVTRLVSAAEVALAAGEGEDCVVVPGGCDAMRRLGDLLAANYPGRVFVLPLPRSSAPRTVDALAASLEELHGWLEGTIDGGQGANPEEEGPSLDHPASLRPGGIFVVGGPLSDDSLLRLIVDLGADLAGLESCTSPQRRQLLSAESSALEAAGERRSPEGDDVSYYRRLAATMLATAMCPRMSTRARREYLAGRLDESRPSAVIYARQSFCDPGAYDCLEAARLAEERGLPFLELEIGFPFEASGPLRTRIEAFLEAQSLDEDLLEDLDGDLLDDLDGRLVEDPS